MARILPFILPDTNFDPETAALLGAAYDKAVAGLHDREQPEVVRQIIAKRIVTLASKGERDPDRLCEAALAGLGLPR